MSSIVFDTNIFRRFLKMGLLVGVFLRCRKVTAVPWRYFWYCELHSWCSLSIDMQIWEKTEYMQILAQIKLWHNSYRIIKGNTFILWTKQYITWGGGEQKNYHCYPGLGSGWTGKFQSYGVNNEHGKITCLSVRSIKFILITDNKKNVFLIMYVITISSEQYP